MSNFIRMRSRPTRRSRVAVFLLFSVVTLLAAIQPQSARAWFLYSMDGPDSALGANTIVDIKFDGMYLWLATQKGVTRALPDGEEFITFGSEVLNSGEISSVAARSGEVWVSPSYSEVRSERLIPFGAGFNYSTDDGFTWQTTRPEQATGAGKICYDMAFMETDQSVWAACFYGGLIRGTDTDTGMYWVNVFPSAAAKLDFESNLLRQLSNRFFSVIVDEISDDSTSVWAGSAAGIKRFVFVVPALKLSGKYAAALFDGKFGVWLGTEAGLSYSLDAGRTWRTYDEEAGFPTSYVVSAFEGPDGIWAGVGADFDSSATPAVTTGAGIMSSMDNGLTWEHHQLSSAVGPGRVVTDFASVNEVMFAACGAGGLIYTIDGGATWDSTLLDDVAAEACYSLVTQDIEEDTTILWAGTDDDLYEFIYTSATLPDTVIHHPIGTDTDTTVGLSHSVNVVEYQSWLNIEGTQVELMEVIWSLHRSTNPDNDLDGVRYSLDRGQSWIVKSDSIKPFAIGFADSVFYLGTDSGLVKDQLSTVGGEATENWLTDLDLILGGDDGVTNVRSLIVSDDSVWVGSDLGIAISANAGEGWVKVTSNPSSSIPDDTLHYSAGDTIAAISGDFITALAMSQYAGVKRIWAATQQTASFHTNGVSVTEDDGATWEVVLGDVLAWNFAFDGLKTYVATSKGLMISSDFGETWETIDVFIDSIVVVVDSDTNQIEFEISKHTEVYSVQVIDGTLWVGTENGLATSMDEGASWDVIRRYKEDATDEPYATPVPYSPSDRITPGYIYFHYLPPVNGPVTFTIYDFANNKVIEWSDGIPRPANEWRHQTDYWDGRNGKGDVVAVGTYFFVIEYSDGSAQWGKLVVLP